MNQSNSVLELDAPYTWGLGTFIYVLRTWGEGDELLCVECLNTGKLLPVNTALKHIHNATTFNQFRYIDA